MPVSSFILWSLDWKVETKKKNKLQRDTTPQKEEMRANQPGEDGSCLSRDQRNECNFTSKTSPRPGSMSSSTSSTRLTKREEKTESSVPISKSGNQPDIQSPKKSNKPENRRESGGAKSLVKHLQHKHTHRRNTNRPIFKHPSLFNLFSGLRDSGLISAAASSTPIASWDASLTQPTALPQHLTDHNYKRKRTFAPISKWVVHPFDPIWLYDELVVHNVEGEKITRAGFSAGDVWKIRDQRLGRYCCKPSSLRKCVTLV